MDSPGNGSHDDHALRRIRSTGDIPHIDAPSRHGHHHNYSGHTRPGDRSTSPRSLTSLSSSSPHSFLGSPPSTTDEHEPRLRNHQPWNAPPLVFPEEPRLRADPPRPTNQRVGIVQKVMIFFGYDGPNATARREVVGVVWNLIFGLGQFVAIVVVLAIAANRESPTNPGQTEWDACERPLGGWDSIWLVRAVLGSILSYWGFKRERATRLDQERRDQHPDPERGRTTTFGRSGLDTAPRTGAANPRNFTARDGRATQGGNATNNENTIQLPYSHLYARLSLLTSVLSLVWFLTAHILEYTSVNTCRHSAPHLWWLTFGILCILYLMILEIFLLGLLVFILGPVLYLAWNIVLLCLGRHPLQNPHYIKPEIGKLSKTVVDQIPLVLYIPPPPEDQNPDGSSKSPITVPTPIYSYPPKKLPPPSVPRRRRFAFFRRSRKSKSPNGSDNPNGSEKGKKKGTWEDHWEAGEYPFVRLEGNRAACAICLMDFEEPKRVDGGASKKLSEDQPEKPIPQNVIGSNPAANNSGSTLTIEEIQVDEVTPEDSERMRLEDAGEGAQPLRLLSCGHVFHKTCLDPWLIDVSGRCPVCQRPVEVPGPGKKKSRQNPPSPPPPAASG